MKKHPPLSADLVRKLVTYDPATGIMTWNARASDMFKAGKHTPEQYCEIWNKRFAGKPAGTPTKKGYVKVHIDGLQYRLHILAWCYMTGEWPKGLVDHRDTDETNNRWVNLREATNSQNLMNRGATRANKLGVKGVYPFKGKFQARLKINGKMMHFGTHRTIDEAAAKIKEATELYHGEFARTV